MLCFHSPTRYYKNTVYTIYENYQAQISQVNHAEAHSPQIIFLKWYAFKVHKDMQELQTIVVSVLWFLNIMSAVGHNIIDTMNEINWVKSHCRFLKTIRF